MNQTIVEEENDNKLGFQVAGKNYTGKEKGRCNQLLWTCKNPDCDYRYKDRQEMVCPECDWQRQYCARYPMNARDHCNLHGGKTLIGIHSPSYKGRGLSKHLPTRLLEQYNLALNDPDVLNMTPEISILESRLADLIRKADEQPGSEIWGKVQKAYTKFRSAAREAEVRKALTELDRLIINGVIEASIWNDIRLLTEQIRKLKDSEKQRRKDAETIITESQFRTIVGYIVNSIQTRVKDDDTRMALMADIARLNTSKKSEED